MAAPATLTWDLTAPDGGARRASLADCGGADFVDDEDPAYAPSEAGDMAYADLLNQWAGQLAALNKTIASAVIEVHFVGGTPGIHAVTACGTNVDVSDFTAQDLGDGVTRVSWAANLLPPMLVRPEASLIYVSGGPAKVGMCAPLTEKESDISVVVNTYRHDNVATDFGFLLLIR